MGNILGECAGSVRRAGVLLCSEVAAGVHAWKQVRSQPSSLQAVPLSASFGAVEKPPASAKRARVRAVVSRLAVSRLAGRAVKLESMTRSEEKKLESRLTT